MNFLKKAKTLEIEENSKVSEQFECTICDAVFTLKENLNKHIESFHDESKSKEPLKCKICYKTGTSIQEMKNHADLMHEGRTSLNVEVCLCKVCSEVFITKDILKKHLESAHGENVPLLEDNENNMGHTEAVHEECSIECTCISSKKKSVKNLKRRLTPQGRGVKAIPSKKARIESVSKNKSDNCEKNNNTPKKSENNNENHSNPKKRRFLEITDNEKEKLLATTDYKVRQEII